MKNISRFFVAALALIGVTSCNTAPVEEVSLSTTTITASFADSRTTLSEGVKTLWAEYDAIEVNGVTFTLKSGAGEATAVFESTTPLAAAESYTATYPAGVSAIAKSQIALAGTFDPEAALAEATGSDANNLVFEHRHALLKFELAAPASKVEIAGYEIAAPNGQMEAQTAYYLAVEAGTYAGLTATVDGVAVKSTESSVEVANGKILNLGTLPNGTAAEQKGIRTAADLVAFAANPAGDEYKDENGVVNILANIDMKDVAWTPITDFAGTLDGNNHTIDNLVVATTESSAALFKNLTDATIQNLTIGSGCSFSASGVDSNNNTYVGSVVARVLTGATIKNVTNYAAVSGGSQMGGICGAADLKKGDVLFENCTNYGSVTFPAQATTANTDIGGICGHNETGVTYRNCVNEGAVSNYSTSGAHYNRVGGLVGLASDHVMEDCTNKGEVKMDSRGASRIWVGGLVGNCYRGTVLNVSNVGNVVVPDATQSTSAAYIAGCFGSLEGNTYPTDGSYYSYKGCSNSASIAINITPTSDTVLGGIIGLLYLPDVKIEECTNSGAMTLSYGKANSCLGGILGVAAKKSETKIDKGAVILNCENTGAITFNETTNTDWVHVGGIVGGHTHTLAFSIEGCTNRGAVTVSSKSRSNPGGIISQAQCDVKDCTNYGTIYSTSTHVDYYSGTGGIVARLNTSGKTVSGCTNYGTIIYNGKGFGSASTKNGIVGQGGIAGLAIYGTITNCANYGVVLGNDYDASLGAAEYINAKGSIAGWAAEKGAVTISGCTVGGAVGSCVDTDEDMGAAKATAVTADNYADYIYGGDAGKGVTVTDCVFGTAAN
ncbi:MAG: hypothetical protein IJX65_08060 [Alistipes sp.]|nr:hypothetical protein [Alistipes sp.]